MDNKIQESNYMGFKCDWLEFTYKTVDGLYGLSVWDQFLETFPEFSKMVDNNELVLLNHGRLGYSSIFVFADYMQIMYNAVHPEMGVHVVFPSHGLGYFCEIFGFTSMGDYVQMRDIILFLKARSCTFTRLDFAYDDYTRTFLPQHYGLWLQEGRISTKCSRAEYICSMQAAASTFYLGKRGGNRFLRIYDKYYESKGSDEEINSIRYEIEFRKDYLQHLIGMIEDGLTFAFSDIIKDFMVIKEPFDNSGMHEFHETNEKKAFSMRKSRAATDPDWDKFVELCNKPAFVSQKEDLDFKIETKRKNPNLKKLKKWIDRQVLPALAVYKETFGEQYLIDAINQRVSKLDRQKQQIIDNYINAHLLSDQHIVFDSDCTWCDTDQIEQERLAAIQQEDWF